MQGPLFTRRHWITQAGLGFGAWALLDLMQRDSRAAAHGRGEPGRSPRRLTS